MPPAARGRREDSMHLRGSGALRGSHAADARSTRLPAGGHRTERNGAPAALPRRPKAMPPAAVGTEPAHGAPAALPRAREEYGSGGRDRTYDQLINSQLLYR